jgi:HD-GYP domain-containing protein (c-di-GMP phosphodiesterase class II)
MIRKSWWLIGSIVTAQLACVGAALVWYARWEETTWRAALIRQHELGQRRAGALWATHLADELRGRLTRAPFDPIPRTTFDAVLLSMSDRALPAPWQWCVVDATGALVADPRLPAAPALRNARPGNWLLASDGAPAALTALLAGHARASGVTAGSAGPQVVAAERLGAAPLSVVIYGPLTAPDTALSVPHPLRRIGLAVAVALVLLSGVVTIRIVSRYEDRQARSRRKLEQKVFQRTSALVQTRDAVMFGLARLTESRDRETGEHISRLQKLSVLLARRLAGRHVEVDSAWVERLRLAAALHDIGKVGIPDNILLKPGLLTPDERRSMQEHTVIGAECLEAIQGRLSGNDFLEMARDIALSHHEWWNGTGYPRGLKSAAIPLAARIVAVADVYDAASSARVYKAAKSHDVVRGLIIAGRGKQFDPEVVDAFLAVEQDCRRVLESERDRPERVAPAAVARRLPVLSGVN